MTMTMSSRVEVIRKDDISGGCRLQTRQDRRKKLKGHEYRLELGFAVCFPGYNVQSYNSRTRQSDLKDYGKDR
ncbi:hypothetical protein Tco_1567512, partial [Tanacetum coccineum]